MLVGEKDCHFRPKPAVYNAGVSTLWRERRSDQTGDRLQEQIWEQITDHLEIREDLEEIQEVLELVLDLLESSVPSTRGVVAP
jgi:hypothetical protein